MKAIKVEGMEIMKVKDEIGNRMSRLDLCISSLDILFLDMYNIYIVYLLQRLDLYIPSLDILFLNIYILQNEGCT